MTAEKQREALKQEMPVLRKALQNTKNKLEAASYVGTRLFNDWRGHKKDSVKEHDRPPAISQSSRESVETDTVAPKKAHEMTPEERSEMILGKKKEAANIAMGICFLMVKVALKIYPKRATTSNFLLSREIIRQKNIWST